MNSYDLGDVVRLSCAFATANGAASDPTAITLRIQLAPAGTPVEAAYPGDIVRDSTGAYHFDFTPAAWGTYNVEWIGTGAVAAGADSRFFIRKPVIE